MRRRKLLQHFFAEPGEPHMNLPTIPVGCLTGHEFFRHEPVHKPDCAVMLDLEALGQFAHGHVIATGEALDGEQRLMVLGRDACRCGRIFAETKELAQGKAECGQVLILGFVELLLASHQPTLAPTTGALPMNL